MSSPQENPPTELSEIIAENFGANATYVETLLARFRSDPSLVDESWRAYFEELLGNGQPVGAAEPPAIAAMSEPRPVGVAGGPRKGAATAPAKKSAPAAAQPRRSPAEKSSRFAAPR